MGPGASLEDQWDAAGQKWWVRARETGASRSATAASIILYNARAASVLSYLVCFSCLATQYDWRAMGDAQNVVDPPSSFKTAELIVSASWTMAKQTLRGWWERWVGRHEEAILEHGTLVA
eukprot:4587136-Pyramimonas_sp.AAC.1